MPANAIEKPKHEDWKDIEGKVWTSKGLRLRHRIAAWWRGHIDGIRGMVHIGEDGVISGPYSTQMVELANESLNAEWRRCGRDMEAFVPYLEQQQAKFDDLAKKLESLNAASKEAEKSAREEVFSGDAEVSESTLARRKSRRATKASAATKAEAKSVESAMKAIREESAEALNDYYARERISVRNEECIRCESSQKFAIYARAACGLFSKLKNRADIGYVASCPLTDKPRSEHFSEYRRYALEVS